MNGIIITEEIPIRLVNDRQKAFLSLNGTILTYRHKSVGQVKIVDVPVEILTVKCWRQRIALRRQWAYLWFLLLPLLIVWTVFGADGEFLHISKASFLFLTIPAFILWLIVFVLMIVRIFRRVSVIGFDLSERHWIVFRPHRNSVEAIEKLLERIAFSKQFVSEEIAYPLENGYMESRISPWLIIPLQMIFFFMPAWILRQPRLIPLCLLPLVRYLSRRINKAKGPPLYRDGLKSFRKRNWGEAHQRFEMVIQQDPQYLPAYLMLIAVNEQLQDFDTAAKILACIQDNLPTDSLQRIQEEMILRKRIYERKQIGLKQ